MTLRLLNWSELETYAAQVACRTTVDQVMVLPGRLTAAASSKESAATILE